MTFAMEFSGSSNIGDGARIAGSGTTEFGLERRSTITIDLTVAGVGLLEYRIDGSDAYIRGQAFAELTGGAARWLHIDLASKSVGNQRFASVLSGQNDASLLIYYLLGASGDAKAVGSETIDSIATTRYALALDLDMALEVIDPALRDTLDGNLVEMRAEGVDPKVAGEVWIDAENLVRRVRYVYALSSVSGGGNLTFTVDLSKLGEAVSVEIPDSFNVTQVDDVVP